MTTQERVMKLIEDRGVKKGFLSNKIGVNQPYFSNFLRDKWNWKKIKLKHWISWLIRTIHINEININKYI